MSEAEAEVKDEEFKVEDHNDLCKVFVIDDSSFSRRMIIKALEEQNLNIVGEAGSASEAITMIGKTGANIIISDIVMPEINGIELAKKFNDGFSEVFFIFVSSLARERIIIESITAGAVDFIEKPFKNEELQQAVLKVCKRVVESSS